MRKSSIAETFPVTSFLLLFIVALFALEIIAHWKLVGELPPLLAGGLHFRVTHLLGSLSWSDIRDGHEYWRLISAAFLHGNLLHILFNGFVLWDMGRICEPFLSSWKLLVVYVASALGGSIGSIAYSAYMAESRPSVGASGALCGLIGLLLVYSVRSRNRDLRDSLLRWIVFIVIFSLFWPRIDHAGHVGGFLVGGALGLTVQSYMSSRAAARWRYPGYLAAAAVIGCLALAVANYLAHRAAA